jgi:hypothetical protein
VHRVRRVEVLVLPKKGHWALNLRMLESLSIWERRDVETRERKRVSFYRVRIFRLCDWSVAYARI